MVSQLNWAAAFVLKHYVSYCGCRAFPTHDPGRIACQMLHTITQMDILRAATPNDTNKGENLRAPMCVCVCLCLDELAVEFLSDRATKPLSNRPTGQQNERMSKTTVKVELLSKIRSHPPQETCKVTEALMDCGKKLSWSVRTKERLPGRDAVKSIHRSFPITTEL